MVSPRNSSRFVWLYLRNLSHFSPQPASSVKNTCCKLALFCSISSQASHTFDFLTTESQHRCTVPSARQDLLNLYPQPSLPIGFYCGFLAVTCWFQAVSCGSSFPVLLTSPHPTISIFSPMRMLDGLSYIRVVRFESVNVRVVFGV